MTRVLLSLSLLILVASSVHAQDCSDFSAPELDLELPANWHVHTSEHHDALGLAHHLMMNEQQTLALQIDSWQADTLPSYSAKDWAAGSYIQRIGDADRIAAVVLPHLGLAQETHAAFLIERATERYYAIYFAYEGHYYMVTLGGKTEAFAAGVDELNAMLASVRLPQTT